MTLLAENLTKRHPSGRGIFGLTIEARAGEVVALIGPSGCGKTTLLRVIAGLAPPDSGRVLVRGRDITTLAPEARNVGMIFQSYALFPHLSIHDNVAYGLRARGRGRREVDRAVADALALVDLAGRSGRIDQLSGGEQQRVAVARAVVTEPHALLLDEPLSNLDPNLRHRMRSGLRAILKRLRIPSIHVTHDQEEALAIGDRVAVLEAGRLVQLDTPERLYWHPRSAFVARFVGAANVISGRVVRSGGGLVDVAAEAGITLAGASEEPFTPGAAVSVAVRPETIDVNPGGGGGFEATVAGRDFLGPQVELRCETSGGPGVVARIPSSHPAAGSRPGDRVRLLPDPGRAHVMPGTPPA